MFWQFLNHWWNLPYLVLVGLVFAYFLAQAIGLVSHASGDHDHDVEHEVDADGDGVPDAAAGHEIDHDHDADGDGEHDGDGASLAGSIAAFLGVGRVPFLVVWLTLFIFAGFGGLITNKVLWDVTGHAYAGWYFPLSLLVSLALGVVATRGSAQLVSKLVDVGGRGASRKQDLAGTLGVVASPMVDREFGEVRVKDARGDELIVHAHTHEGDPALAQGERVVLTGWDAVHEVFTVAAIEKGAPEPPGGGAREGVARTQKTRSR